jgi:hypothetical protein
MATGALIQQGAGVTSREEFSSTEVTRQAETAQAALMAQQKAMIEARFVVAMRNKRSWLNIRSAVNELCQDPGFAAEAEYVKPIGRTPDGWNELSKRDKLLNAPSSWPRGFSIRFIEAVLFEAGNFQASTTIIWEDDTKRLTQVAVTDLQSNSSYDGTVVTPKMVERSKVYEGQEVIGVRENSFGKKVYLVAATQDQVTQAEAAGKSKMLRTLGEKLLPPHYKREWREICDATILDKLAKDPKGEQKKLLDSFAEQGVMPSAIEAYLEHPLDSFQPAEMMELRRIYVAITNGEATWKDVLEAKFGVPGETPDDDKKPKEPSRAATALRERLEKTAGKGPGTAQKSEVKSEQKAEQKPPADLWPDVVKAFGGGRDGEAKAIAALARNHGFESWSQVNAADRPGVAAKLIEVAK